MSVEGQTFPKSVQPGIPKLGSTPKGWKRYRIGDLFDVVSRPTDLHDDREYDLVTVKRSRGGIERRNHLLGRQISVKSQFLLEDGDFLISKRQIVHGACAVVPAEFSGSIVSNEYSVLRPRPVLSLNYLRYLVHSIYLQQTFFHSSVGVHVEKMIFRLEDWFKWPIHLPPVAEQEKLGRGLMDADAKITLLTDKKTALEDYKRGLMQRLFSRELRFTRDDGSPFPDWEKLPFQQLATRVTDSFDPRSGFDSQPILIELENIESKTGRIIGSVEIADQISLKTSFHVGDILFGKLRPYLRKFARPQFDGICSSEIWVLKGRKASSEFLFYLVQSERFIAKAIVSSSGSKMPRADWQTVADTMFWLPHPDEQHKIAGTLSTLDAKIDAMSQKISEMEAFKKGLLQKLFV